MKIGIAAFSGTGNTAFVANLLGKSLRDLDASVEIFCIDATFLQSIKDDYTSLDLRKYDLFGIGHPVLGFGPSELVLRFAESLAPGRGKVFVFKSAADNHRINNSASEQLIKKVEQKGYEVFHDFLYVMPCNWLVNYPRRLNLQLIDRAEEKAAHHAQDLVKNASSRMPVYRGWRLLASIFHVLESGYGRRYFGRALVPNDSCTYCRLCIDNCPNQNIHEENHKILFGERCLWCMRCVYNCPVGAIKARWMNWCILSGGYSLNRLLSATDIERIFINTQTHGYWKHFRDYFEQDKLE